MQICNANQRVTFGQSFQLIFWELCRGGLVAQPPPGNLLLPNPPVASACLHSLCVRGEEMIWDPEQKTQPAPGSAAPPARKAFTRSSHPAAGCHHLRRQREARTREERWDYLKNAFVLIQTADGRGRWLPKAAAFPARGRWGQLGLRWPYGALLQLTPTQLGTAGASWLLHLQGWSWKLEINQML